jgi:hypothetical protein
VEKYTAYNISQYEHLKFHIFDVSQVLFGEGGAELLNGLISVASVYCHVCMGRD